MITPPNIEAMQIVVFFITSLYFLSEQHTAKRKQRAKKLYLYRKIFALVMSRSTTIAFTGHRHYRGEVDAALSALLQRCYEEGYRTFLCGMAVGFDLAAAEAVVALRSVYADVRLVAVIPFAGQAQRFSERAQRRYERVVEVADERVVLSPSFHRGCYQQRNLYMIDRASLLIAWYNGTSGGTEQTYLAAQHRGLRIENLGRVAPDLRLF